jgi:hypothetical protein
MNEFDQVREYVTSYAPWSAIAGSGSAGKIGKSLSEMKKLVEELREGI